jgi:hypothetical protein
MKKAIAIAFLFIAAASLPARAQELNLSTHTARNWRYFFAFDYYLPMDAGDGLQNQLHDYSGTLINNKGYSGTDFRVKTTGGVGARFGGFYPVTKRIDAGLSFGYVLGPNMSSNFDAIGGPGNGSLTINRDVYFLRFLGQAHTVFPLTEDLSFMLGGGVGVATARVKQGCESSGTLTCVFTTQRRSWTGLSWELTPSLYYHLGRKIDFRFGPRWAGFPTFGGNDQVARFSWTPLGFFAGAMF